MLQAHAQVQTPKASRYLKALCNHFNRKVSAEYNDQHGSVQFGFGVCTMDASADVLTLRVQAEDVDNFARVKWVVADHLIRFSSDEGLEVVWVNQA